MMDTQTEDIHFTIGGGSNLFVDEDDKIVYVNTKIIGTTAS